MLFKMRYSRLIESWTSTTTAVHLNLGFFGLRTIDASISCAGVAFGSRRKLPPSVRIRYPDSVEAAEPAVLGVGRAIEHVVTSLPPKERACVLLKDVFDYTLEEIAELVESTVGGVKAALNRGRSKLAASPSPVKLSGTANAELTRVLQLYVERFNRRDWNGLRELIAADARLRVADAFAGKLVDSPYFGNYERFPMPWKLAAGEVDGEPVVIILQRGADTWTPYSTVRLHVTENHIDRIVDYVRCCGLLMFLTQRILAWAQTVMMNGGSYDEVHSRRLFRENRS